MDDNSTPTLLTLGTHTLMNEDEGKYRVTQNENHWYLHINRIQVIDRGLYMCQINAKTMLSQIGYLDVYGMCMCMGFINSYCEMKMTKKNIQFRIFYHILFSHFVERE